MSRTDPLLTPSNDDRLGTLAAELPIGYKMLGEEQAQAQLYVSFDAGDDVWEIEYCALDPERNFIFQERTLGALLARACERVGVR